MNRGHLLGGRSSPPISCSRRQLTGPTGMSSGVCTASGLLSRLYSRQVHVAPPCTRVISCERKAPEMVPEELLSMFKELSMDGKLPHILERTTQENTEASLQLARLQREKEWLELRLTKRRKDIQLERSQVEALGQQISAIERKLQRNKEANKRVWREQRHLEATRATLEEVNSTLQREKKNITQEYLEWVEKKNEFVAETAKERRQADVVRRQRGKQVKGLLRALNRESRLQVERDILRPFGGCLRIQPTTRPTRKARRPQHREAAAELTEPSPHPTPHPQTLNP